MNVEVWIWMYHGRRKGLNRNSAFKSTGRILNSNRSHGLISLERLLGISRKLCGTGGMIFFFAYVVGFANVFVLFCLLKRNLPS